MTTQFPSATSALASRRWWIIDATDVPLGRLASRAATLLLGKDKASFTPFLDTGDFVVVTNCEKALLTGRKEKRKLYRHHTGYPGGFREVAADKLRERHPVRMVEQAICGMLPKTRLGRAMGRKLKVYTGAEHPHVAQAPTAIAIPRRQQQGARG